MQLKGETKSPKNSSTPPSPKIEPHHIFHGVGDWGSTTPQTRNAGDFKVFLVPDIKEELGFYAMDLTSAHPFSLHSFSLYKQPSNSSSSTRKMGEGKGSSLVHLLVIILCLVAFGFAIAAERRRS
ncbi:unnamed protein product [Lactuca virosa]|uniref:Uncharacterized protein n=1 Tax=Lactuca virosa TaxID=75947 RepID=A0AAU9PGE9_9ASTR|nr:unnamed protein product [Lactuca virosa]